MIEAQNLTKKFDDTAALDGINIKIEEGSVFGLVGSNGSGKSTLLRLISGVYTPDDGQLLVDGEQVFDNNELKSKICYLSDTPYFVHQSNLNEMIRFYKLFYPSFSEEKFEELNRLFPLDRKKRISTMSKGMQRQAALMLCLSTKPRYLLLDEAFDGLDAVMRKTLKSLLAERVSNGLTTVIASHNLRELEELCDSVGLLHSGKILFNDQIENFKSNVHKVQAVFGMVPETTVFDGLDILKLERTGSIISMVVRGEEKEILDYIGKLFPTFVEVIEPTFEEVFTYELGVNGYDAKEIME
ncbi:MAG: ABC transporter ATP-binding protein [Clostridiales bacterium]|nr:ABC transporter ATP-binding protein [Candidatus Equinaster intestinalis]